MGEKNCDLPLKNGAMGAKRPNSLPLNAAAAAATKLWQKPPISPSLRRARLAAAGDASAASVPTHASSSGTGAKAKVTTCLQVTPSPVTPGGGGGTHQRSFTSVNLTLRPPSAEPQPPIDITSAHASLTYSTSSFDMQKGLESRLQITVSPTGGSVASYRRRRPRPHSYHDGGGVDETSGSTVAHRSLPDLTTTAAADAATLAVAENLGPPAPSATIRRQQAKLERLKVELSSERRKLVAMQQEVARLAHDDDADNEDAVNAELEKQLLGEIRHLRGQCERLSIEMDQHDDEEQQQQQRRAASTAQRAARARDEAFYRNIYLGQRHPPNFGRAASEARAVLGEATVPAGTSAGGGGGGWSCPKCTFHNHPEMGKCEQCDMPYILHVSAAPGDNIHIHVTPRITRRIVHSWVI